MARIENHKYTIEEAFLECFYIIPDYQREYVWTDKEVTQLVEDINEQIDTEAEQDYFIGTILVSPADRKNHFEVIDGQQRLTTFFLLLCALRNLIEGVQQQQFFNNLIKAEYTNRNGDIAAYLKLTPRYENAEDVIGKLVELNDAPEAVRAKIQASGIKSFGSLEKLIAAYGVLHRYLRDNFDTQKKLKNFWGYLARNVVFIQISTDVSTALKIFETVNERGVGLNSIDLLKNLLFKQVDSDKFTKLKDEWKKITTPLEKAKEKPLRFLRYFIMANYTIKNQRNDAMVREDEIYEWLVEEENAGLCGYLEDPFVFVRKIIRNVEYFTGFVDGRANDGAPSAAMENLRHLTGGAFSLHYILLLAAAPLPKVLFEHFVVQLESFLFYYIFTKTPTKELERNFSVWADELRRVASHENTEQQKNALNDFIAGRFEKNMQAKAQELFDALRRLSFHSMQFYRIRYLLARFALYVEAAFNGGQPTGSLEGFVKLEVEHILPNTPGAELLAYWNNENPQDATYDDYKNRLGNLTLLERPINIVASNDFYSEKTSEYGKSAIYFTRSLAALTEVGTNSSITRINEKLSAFDHWNADTIKKRHEMLVQLAQEVWIAHPFKG